MKTMDKYDDKKNELKASLRVIIELLNDKEADVVHDYGKSAVELATEMIWELALGGF